MAKKEFVLRHEFKNVKDLVEGKYYRSEWEENYDVRWRVSTCKTEEHLDLYLKIDIEKGSVLAEFKLSIIKANGEVLSKGPGKNLFEPGMTSNWGYEKFTDWKNVIDNCLVDGNLKVEAQVTILEMNGFKDSMSEKEFVLRHEFKNVRDLIADRNNFGEWEKNYNVRWRLGILKREEYLGLYLYADIEEGSKQSVLVEKKFCIVKTNGEVISKGPSKNLFETENTNWGYKHFTDWKNVIDNCLIDGNLKVEAHVTILEIKRFKDSMSEKEFVLRHEFQNVKDFKKGNIYYSEREKNYDVRWRLCTVQNEEHLGLYLEADLEEGSKQSVLVEDKLCIIKANGEVISTGPNETLFEPGDANTWGRREFTGWKNVMDNCLIDGNLKVEAHVTILEMKGFTRKMLRSFGEDAKKHSDMTLIVGQEKFYISKLFLSAHSSYFDTLFLGPFQESGRAEVQLKDVNPIDLQYFLEVLYGDSNIDDLTVRKILSLADMYDTQIIVKNCEEFLREKSKKSLQEKLQLAGKYKLEDLKESCLEKINSVADFREAIPSNLREMDPDFLADLLEKILDLY